MDFSHALHGQPRSMSCESILGSDNTAREVPSNSSSLETAIASTVVPASFSDRDPSLEIPLPASPESCTDPPLEASIPLPPSPLGYATHDEDAQELEAITDVHGASQASAMLSSPSSPVQYRQESELELAEPSEPFVELGQSTLIDLQDRDEPEKEEAVGAHTMDQDQDQDRLRPLKLSQATDDTPGILGEYPVSVLPEEGPELRTLGIPSENTEGQDTPTQIASHSFPLSLSSVLDIFRRSRYEAERCSILRNKVNRLLHRYGHRRRLAPVLTHRHRQLVRCHREDYASEFVTLYAEIPDTKAKPVAASQGDESGNDVPTDDAGPDGSWISHLSTAAHANLLRLIDSIRGDEDFLASRIARLPSPYLDHLSRLHTGHASDATGPSRPFGMRGNSRPPSRLSAMPETFEGLDDIRRDPLQVMIHGLFDCADGSGSAEGLRREKVWSSVCAKLINQEVHGAEKLVVAVMNELAQSEPWRLGPQLEVLLLGWIQAGSFILDPDSVPNYKDEPEEVRKSRVATDQSRFLEAAMEQLLDLLTKNVEHAVPIPSLKLIRSVLAKVVEGKRERTKHLLAATWYCQTFLQNMLVCPELHGLLDRQHVRKDIRTKLFYGVYARIFAAFEYAHGAGRTDSAGLLSPCALDQTRRLLAIFDVPQEGSIEHHLITTTIHDRNELAFLNVSGSDVLSLLVTLFPRADKSPDPSGNSLFGRAFSMASSMAGGSRATTTGTLTPMFGTTSSVAPSTSSTSITSDTFFSENAHSNDSISVGMSEEEFVNFSPAVAAGLADEAKYLSIAREIRGLLESSEAKRKKTKTKKPVGDAAAVLYLIRSEVSLDEPRPVGSNDDRSEFVVSPSFAGRLGAHLRNTFQLTLDHMVHTRSLPPTGADPSSTVTAIGDYLVGKLQDAQADYDFVAAHQLHKASTAFMHATTEQRTSVLQELTESTCRQACESQSLSEMYQDWIVDLDSREKLIDRRLENVTSKCRSLRDKQWFSSFVCHSSEYRDSLNIVRALASMATGKVAKQSGIAGWAKMKLKASFGSQKAQQQAFLSLSAPQQHGGPCKLTDDQAELVANWLTNNSIENFCNGEERVHRFCYEIQRCTQKLVGDTMIASPVLWSSNLYEKEKSESGGLQGTRAATSAFNPSPTPRQGSFSQAPSPQPNGSRIFPFSLSPPHSRSVTGIKDFASLQPQHTRPSILDSPIRFSTAPENALGLQTTFAFPPSPVSPNAAVQQPQHQTLSASQLRFLADLRKTVTSLLLSDLGLSLWMNGSETDRWVNEERLHHESVSVKIGSPSHPDLTQLARSPPELSTADPGIDLFRWNRDVSEAPEEQRQQQQQQLSETSQDTVAENFPYEDAYTRILARFRLSPDPYHKLDALHDLVCLISLAPSIPDDEGSTPDSHNLATQLRLQYAAGMPNRSIPRTSLTKLQEVTVNCEERRVQSLAMTPLSREPVSYRNASTVTLRHPAVAAAGEWLGDPKITNMIQALLLDRAFYPAVLFRDLQMISSFVPSAFLDSSPQGAAFWTIGLAAMQLKSALCAAMIDRAAQITNFHVDRGNKGREPVRQDRQPEYRDGNSDGANGEGSEQVDPSAAAARHRAASPNRNYRGRTLTDSELRSTSLADAGQLFRVAALEGDPAAARELGLFYLTHPEHVRRTLRPLSKPSEVARMAGSASGGSERTNLSGVNPPIGRNDGHARSSLKRGVEGDDAMNVDAHDVSVDGRDSGNLATAWHWMEFAADGGDEQAKYFLTSNTDLRWDAQGRRIWA